MNSKMGNFLLEDFICLLKTTLLVMKFLIFPMRRVAFSTHLHMTQSSIQSTYIGLLSNRLRIQRSPKNLEKDYNEAHST
jgi:hypothetical protein